MLVLPSIYKREQEMIKVILAPNEVTDALKKPVMQDQASRMSKKAYSRLKSNDSQLKAVKAKKREAYASFSNQRPATN